MWTDFADRGTRKGRIINLAQSINDSRSPGAQSSLSLALCTHSTTARSSSDQRPDNVDGGGERRETNTSCRRICLNWSRQSSSFLSDFQLCPPPHGLHRQFLHNPAYSSSLFFPVSRHSSCLIAQSVESGFPSTYSSPTKQRGWKKFATSLFRISTILFLLDIHDDKPISVNSPFRHFFFFFRVDPSPFPHEFMNNFLLVFFTPKVGEKNLLPQTSCR